MAFLYSIDIVFLKWFSLFRRGLSSKRLSCSPLGRSIRLRPYSRRARQHETIAAEFTVAKAKVSISSVFCDPRCFVDLSCAISVCGIGLSVIQVRCLRQPLCLQILGLTSKPVMNAILRNSRFYMAATTRSKTRMEISDGLVESAIFATLVASIARV